MATIPNADLTFAPREVLTADKMNKLVANDKSLLDSVNKIDRPATQSANGLLSAADKKKLDGIFSAIYPVGSIYMSVKSTNPGSLFGGTWVQWGAGRVPVGMGSNGTTNYTTVEKTGGEEKHKLTIAEMPGHMHDLRRDGKGQLFNLQGGGTNGQMGLKWDAVNDNTNVYPGSLKAAPEGGNQSHNNMQPYITCYMWKRTA